MTPNVVTTSECGYAFHLTFCHSATKNRYAQIISGYVPAEKSYTEDEDKDLRKTKILQIKNISIYVEKTSKFIGVIHSFLLKKPCDKDTFLKIKVSNIWALHFSL